MPSESLIFPTWMFYLRPIHAPSHCRNFPVPLICSPSVVRCLPMSEAFESGALVALREKASQDPRDRPARRVIPERAIMLGMKTQQASSDK